MRNDHKGKMEFAVLYRKENGGLEILREWPIEVPF